jgi:di/tricarboxylate transporter
MKARNLEARFLVICAFLATFVSTLASAAHLSVPIVVSVTPASRRLAKRWLSRLVRLPLLFVSSDVMALFVKENLETCFL